MGAVGGGAVNLFKGVYNSPRGRRFPAGFDAIRREAPKIGGSFAVWGGLFSAFDCTLVALRHKEDPRNPILSGALTGGVLQVRYGFSSAARSAAFGGLLLGLIEGVSIMLNRMTAPLPEQSVSLDTLPETSTSGSKVENVSDIKSGGSQPASIDTTSRPETGDTWGSAFGAFRQHKERANAK